MVHLSSTTGIMVMIFYSALTFFIAPMATFKYTKNMDDPCMMGFIIGFVVSIGLWHFYGKDLILGKK